MDNRLHFLAVAKSCLGKDQAPLNDDFGCAEALNTVFKKAFGREIGGGASTYRMFQILKTDSRFEKVDLPLPGDIIMSATGYGNPKKIRNGHVGVVSEGGKIMSNTSSNGLWEENYTLTTWKRRWKDYGGYPMDYFRVYTPHVPAPQPIPVVQPLKPTQTAPQPTQTLMPAWLQLFLDRNRTLGAKRNPKWAALSRECISEHPYCAFHGGKGTLINPLQSHHIIPVHVDPKLEMEKKNILVLCWFCHFWHAHLGNYRLFNLNIRKHAAQMQKEREVVV